MDEKTTIDRKIGQVGKAKNFPGLNEFVTTYLEPKTPSNWHHELFYDILENKVVQGKDGKLYLNTSDSINKTILTLAPRFHAKSQCFTIHYPLWRINKNPNIRIIIVSANEEIAVSFNRAIVNHLENNEKLNTEFPILSKDEKISDRVARALDGEKIKRERVAAANKKDYVPMTYEEIKAVVVEELAYISSNKDHTTTPNDPIEKIGGAPQISGGKRGPVSEEEAAIEGMMKHKANTTGLF